MFVREYDRTIFMDQIRAYGPEGGSRIVWREAEAIYVRSHGGFQLLPGPRFR